MRAVCTDKARPEHRLLETPHTPAVVMDRHSMAFRRDFVTLKYMTETASFIDESLVKAHLTQVDVFALKALVTSAPDRFNCADVTAVVVVQYILLNCVFELEVIGYRLPTRRHHSVEAICTQVEVGLSPGLISSSAYLDLLLTFIAMDLLVPLLKYLALYSPYNLVAETQPSLS